MNSLKTKSKRYWFVPVLLMSVVIVAPNFAIAGVSTSVSLANMYLWRGQNLTPSGAQASGSLDYSHDVGFYTGVWTSTEDDGNETDLYLGYGKSFGLFGFDISYWNYIYPSERENANPTTGTRKQIGLGDSNAAEVVLGLSLGPVAFTSYVNADSDNDDNIYFTLSGDAGKFNVLYGFWSLDNPGAGTAGNDEYSHLQLGFSATDEVSMAVSIAFSDLDGVGVEEDPLFMIAYSKSFDL